MFGGCCCCVCSSVVTYLRERKTEKDRIGERERERDNVSMFGERERERVVTKIN